MINLQIFNEVKKFKVPSGRILKAFGSFLEKEKMGGGARKSGRAGGEINVIFVDEAAITRLNEIWKGRKGSTDVLTFDYSEKKGVANGEIYICPKVAERYVKEARVGAGKSIPLNSAAVSAEVLNLFVHGLLHLAGYTHETEGKLAAMMKRAEEILGEG